MNASTNAIRFSESLSIPNRPETNRYPVKPASFIAHRPEPSL